MEGVINSRHAPLVWKSNPSSVYPRLSSPRTIISTPFGERRRFSLCRLVHNLDRSLRAPCSCCCCNCCFCCCFSQRRKAAELSCYSFRDVTRLAVIFSTIHLDARLFIYTSRWGKVGGGKNSENNDRFFIRIRYAMRSESERRFKIRSHFFPSPGKEYFNFLFQTLGRF